MHHHLKTAGPNTADESCTIPALVYDVTVKEQPYPAAEGSVLPAVNVTTPILLPAAPVLAGCALRGQPLAAGSACHTPAMDARPTLVPARLITTVTVALHVTCGSQPQQNSTAASKQH